MDTKEKSVQLFTYLKEMSALRTKQVKNIKNYEEVIWVSEIPKLADCYCVAWSLWAKAVDDKERRRDVWIEVHKPKLKSPPEVPDDLEPWIKEEEVFDSSVEEPSLLEEIIVLSELEGEERTNVFSINEHTEIIDVWVEYIESKWKPWAEEDRRLQQIQRVYNDLFTIYQRAEKLGEQYEVVIGAGYLLWRSSNSGEIRHPIVTFQGRVEFDRVRGIISVYAAFNGPQPKLEIDMLETSDRPGVSDLQAIVQMVDELNGNAWDGPALEAILKSFANGISTQSLYENSITKPAQISDAPQIHFAPSLILRRRTRRTFVDYYQGIIDQLMENSKIPESVRRLVEIVEDDAVPEEIIPVQHPPHMKIKDSELYFPLRANDEQKQIALRIEQQQGLLVQGPPGTGKSHTITNLVAHFLAKGQRVLVTSETPRALEVLRQMLPEEIRELCVVWLGAGPEAQKSLEKSVNGITQKKVSWESSSADKEILDLEKRLDEVRREQARLRKELTSFREADTYQHSNIFNTYNGTLEKIAIKAKTEQDQYGWFLDRPDSDSEPQVTAMKLNKMIQIHRQLSVEVQSEIRMRHLPVDKLIVPTRFKKLVDKESLALAQHKENDKSRSYTGYEELIRLNPDSRNHMLELLKNLMSRLDQLSKHVHGWVDRAAREIAADQDRIWRQLLEITEEHLNALMDRSRKVSQHKITGIEGYNHSEVDRHARELKEHLENGKGLGFGPLRSKPVKQAVYLIKKIRVDGEVCKSTAVLDKLIDWLNFEKRLDELSELWKAHTTPPQGSFAVQLATYQDLCVPLSEAIEVHQVVKELKVIVSQLPVLASPRWHFRQDIESLCDAVAASIDEEDLRISREAFVPLERTIAKFNDLKGAHPATQQILDALRKRDTKSYGKSYQKISQMNKWVQIYRVFQNIIERFKKEAPKTAEEYKSSFQDKTWEGRFSQFDSAWRWGKIDSWLSERCDINRGKHLGEALEQKQKDERIIIKKLAAKKAWRHCMNVLGETERQALIAWKQAVERIKQGFGRHAETHRETARQKLEECRKAIPAWVMPLYQVVQTTKPQVGLFDIVIVDEASQSGPEGLFLNYIGKKIIVVGDNKQITPLHIGVNRDHVEYLRRMHIKEIPHSQALDIDSSLFSLAELRFPGRVRLREHFRCMPEIIQFSNNLSYSTEPLFPLRQYGADRLDPVVTKYVEDGYRKGRSPNIVNEPEAKAIVEQIVECCEDTTYENKTFGVISLLGSSQSTVIGNLLVKEIGAEEIENRRLLCGSPYDFQGDERDIIFLSMVDAPQEGRVCRMVRDAETQRRFNVAASRAKDQLWLFHTPTLNDLRQGCLRYRLLEYCLNPSVKQSKVEGLDIEKLRQLSRSEARDRTSAPEPFDSWFEVDVFLMIAERDYRVLPQYEVAGFKIDMVVEGLKGRMAVECDGDEWHGPERFNHDLRRQLELERCGWIFWRCRGSEFYRDPDLTMESLWVQLKQLAIYPENDWGEERRKQEENADESSMESDLGSMKDEETDKEFEADEIPEAEETMFNCQHSTDAIKKDEKIPEGRLDSALEFGKKLVKRPEDLSARTIQQSIKAALADCPNQTCTTKSITSRVLKKLGLRTRGNPWAEFDRRVKRNIGVLKRKSIVEEYKAKNKRLRLIPTNDQRSLFKGKQKKEQTRESKAEQQRPIEIIIKKSEYNKPLETSISKGTKKSKSEFSFDPANMIDPLQNLLHYLVAESDRKCESCGNTSTIMIGRFGPFLKCSNSKCNKTKGIEFSKLKELFNILQIPCIECGSPMTVAKGYKGKPFPGCCKYPKCKTPEQWKDLRERIRQKNVRKQLGANKYADL